MLDTLLAEPEILDKEIAERSLVEFTREFWRYVDPVPFRSNWHIEAIAEHLEAVNRGEIRRLLINIPPRHCKPVWNGETILTAAGPKILRDIVVGDLVLTHTGRYRRVLAVREQGVLPVLQISTARGRVVQVALDHPFLTPRGWIAAQDLCVGEALAAVTPQEDPQVDVVDKHEARLLGYLVGDGNCTCSTPTFTNADHWALQDFDDCAQRTGFRAKARKLPASRGTICARSLVAGGARERYGPGAVGPVRRWLGKHGLEGKDSYSKRVPKAVLDSSKMVLEAFLAAYWNCDGTIQVKHKARASSDGYQRDICIASATTVSKALARDLQHVAQRLGINLRVRRRVANIKTKRQGTKYVSFTVETTAHSEVSKFARLDYLMPRKRQAAESALATQFPTTLAADRIIAITKSEPVDCRCLTVEEDESFTVKELAVHNSSLVSVMWPAWTWVQPNLSPVSGPQVQFMYSSYAQSLSTRDSVKCRRVIESPLYQERWNQRFKMTTDVNTKQRFENSKNGYRIATSVDGALTGEGGMILSVDDPHNVREAESETVREAAIKWWAESMSTRLNDAKTGVYVVIMQRVHHRDLSGYILEQGGDWVHLCLPAKYELDHPYLWDGDQRTQDGELLWPGHFPQSAIDEIERSLGGHAAAGQLQQRPSPRSGGMFQSEWWQYCEPDEVPTGGVVARGWDLAGTEEYEAKRSNASWTVGVKMRLVNKKYYIEDVVRLRGSPAQVEATILATARRDGFGPIIDLPQDPGQAGKAQVRYLVRQLAGYNVRYSGESGSKPERALGLSAQAEGRNVYLVRGSWNRDFVEETESFPSPQNDQVDASSRAFHRLSIAPIFPTGAKILGG